MLLCVVVMNVRKIKVDVCPKTENQNVCQAPPKELAVWYTKAYRFECVPSIGLILHDITST